VLELRTLVAAELDIVCELERDIDTLPYILPTSRAQHEAYLAREDVVYLSIYRQDRFSGYFILVRETDGQSIELRRIVIAEKGLGTGREAILRLEDYCRDELGLGRIWLDVFEINDRGMHLYPSLGYRYTGDRQVDGRRLLFFEKYLR
jgi:RimJ/RimL family protein N-acetyltransferase